MYTEIVIELMLWRRLASRTCALISLAGPQRSSRVLYVPKRCHEGCSTAFGPYMLRRSLVFVANSSVILNTKSGARLT